MATDRALLEEVETKLDVLMDEHCSHPITFALEALRSKIAQHLNEEAEEHDSKCIVCSGPCMGFGAA